MLGELKIIGEDDYGELFGNMDDCSNWYLPYWQVNPGEAPKKTEKWFTAQGVGSRYVNNCQHVKKGNVQPWFTKRWFPASGGVNLEGGHNSWPP
jgi:hypothetical protein